MPGFSRFSSRLTPVSPGGRRAAGIQGVTIAYLVQGAGGGGSQGTSSVNWGAGGGAGIARAGTLFVLGLLALGAYNRINGGGNE
jgi:hypothetical protein